MLTLNRTTQPASAVDRNADASADFAHKLAQTRAALQQEQLQRLRDGANCPLIVLPAITSHAVGPDEVEEIASLLADQLSQLD